MGEGRGQRDLASWSDAVAAVGVDVPAVMREGFIIGIRSLSGAAHAIAEFLHG